MSKPRLALLFFGISYMERFNNRFGSVNSVDYRECLSSQREMIYKYFTDLGYTIDIFLCTNPSSLQDQVVKDYKPVAFRFENGCRGHKIKIVFDLVWDYSKENNIEYDLILLTRFDIKFMIPLAESNIKLDHLNIVSILEEPDLICDNFYLMPGCYLESFKAVSKKAGSHGHQLKAKLERLFNVNYMFDQHCVVANLKFYKIIRCPPKTETL